MTFAFTVTVHAATAHEITYRDFELDVTGRVVTVTDTDGNAVTLYVVDEVVYIPVAVNNDMLAQILAWSNDINNAFVKAQPVTDSENKSDENNNSAGRVEPETKSYSGQLKTSEQVDDYDFSLPCDARVQLSFKHGYIDDGRKFWYIQFIDKNSGKLHEFRSVGNVTDITSDHAMYLPKGEYFVRVSKDYHSTEPYTVTIIYEKNNDAFEYEPNDTTDSATKITLDVPVIGNLSNNSDVDYYYFTVDSSMDTVIEFSHGYFDDSRIFWHLQLLQENGVKMFETRFVGNMMKDTTDTIKVQPGKYYIRIEKDYYSDLDYTLTIKAK